MKKKLIIFGTGDIADIAYYYFNIDSNYQVVCFTIDQKFIKSQVHEGLPVVAFEEVDTLYPPNEHEMFIALSYSQMNKVRQNKYLAAKKLGYSIASYISTHCTFLSQFPPGENAFILENNTIQPFVRIGDNVTLWSGNHIGHHSIIMSHNFISSHVVISGHCVIEENCFLGVNATIAHKVKIVRETLLGAGSVISKDTEEKSVYVAPRSIKLDYTSDMIKL